MLVAGEFTPCIGDCGGVRGAKRVGLSTTVHGRAFSRYGDPRYARALEQIRARDTDLWNRLFDERKVAEAAQTAPSHCSIVTTGTVGSVRSIST